MLGGSTRLVALLGHPVAHSLSPRMQNAAFAARGLDWAYVALDVSAEDLERAVRGLLASGFAGANVTIPHKRAAAHPAHVDYLYFVRKPDHVHHYFTKSFNDFVNHEKQYGY